MWHSCAAAGQVGPDKLSARDEAYSEADILRKTAERREDILRDSGCRSRGPLVHNSDRSKIAVQAGYEENHREDAHAD